MILTFMVISGYFLKFNVVQSHFVKITIVVKNNIFHLVVRTQNLTYSSKTKEFKNKNIYTN